MDKLLKLKDWQMFLLFMFPFFFQFFPSPELLEQIVGFMDLFIWVGWVFIVGSVACDKLPDKYGINKTFFQVSCILIVGYITSISIVFDKGYSITLTNYGEYGPSAPFLVFGTFYIIFSFFYIFYFAAKMLRSNVEGKLVGFNNYLGYMLCFYFPPIGVWFIQPKANKLADNIE